MHQNSTATTTTDQTETGLPPLQYSSRKQLRSLLCSRDVSGVLNYDQMETGAGLKPQTRRK